MSPSTTPPNRPPLAQYHHDLDAACQNTIFRSVTVWRTVKATSQLLMIFTSFWLTLQGILPVELGFAGMLIGYVGPESAESILVKVGQQAFADAVARDNESDDSGDSGN